MTNVRKQKPYNTENENYINFYFNILDKLQFQTQDIISNE